MAIEISALADTWNSSGTAKYAIKFDVTDTASATASKLLELMVASSSKFGVRKDGRVNFASGTLFDSSGDGGGAFKTSAASSLLSWDTSGNTTLAGTLGSGAITSTGNVTAGASSRVCFSAGTQIAPNGDGGLYIKNAAGTTVFTFASDGAISTGGTITGDGFGGDGVRDHGNVFRQRHRRRVERVPDFRPHEVRERQRRGRRFSEQRRHEQIHLGRFR